MAKYDDKRMRNELDYNKSRGETMYGQNKAGLDAQGSTFGNYLNQAAGSDEAMRNAAMSGYQNFANTGGFSPMDKANMRARSNSPIRAAYANAQQGIERNRALGGTSAGQNTLMGRMAREQGQAASDATTNTEAGIAAMVNQNKLAGLGGISNLYGTAPGASSLWSRNVMGNMGQQLDLQKMENERMQGILNSRADLTKAPGNTDKALQWGGEVTDIGKKIFSPPTGGYKLPWEK